MKPWRAALALVWLALLSACGSLPHRPELPPSEAIAVESAAQTALGRIARQSLRQDSGFDSGFQLLPVGPSALDARLALIARAEKSVDAQYYLVQNDAAGLAFLRALRSAARRGVRVRLLVDDLFTIETETLLRALSSEPQMDVRVFNPFARGRFSNLGRLLGAVGDLERVNHRMHNKLLVVDNAIAISGGRNIADEYFNYNVDANFIDLDVLSAGQVVPELSKAFDLYWNSAFAYPMETIAGPATPQVMEHSIELLDGLRPWQHPPLPEGESSAGEFLVEQVLAQGHMTLVMGRAQVLADRPDKVQSHYVSEADMRGTVNRGVLEVLESAQSELVMVSPYFLPLQRHIDTMRWAVQQHRRVVVITNSIGSTDEPLVYAAYAKKRKEMLQSGVEIFEINPEEPVKYKTLGDFRSAKGGLHAKAALVDRQRIFIGSMNLDARSAIANTELGMIIDSPELAQEYGRMLRSSNLAYRLRLNAAGDIEWIELDDAGRETVHASEPNLGFWARLKLFFLSPLVSERLL